MTPAASLQVFALHGIPEVRAGDPLASLLALSLRAQSLSVEPGDVLVVTQKVVSKAEGRLVRLEEVEPGEEARRWALEGGRDPRVMELVRRQSVRIVRRERDVIIAETRHGFVCANAGVDVSNVPVGMAALLPLDPDASARALRQALGSELGRSPAVVVSDTFGRPWREGQVDVAIGVAGLHALLDHRGRRDAQGRVLLSTVIAVADELASAAELVMGKSEGIPAALVRGARVVEGEGTARALVRPAERDLFR